MTNIYRTDDSQSLVGTLEVLNGGIFWITLTNGKVLSLTRIGFIEWLERNEFWCS